MILVEMSFVIRALLSFPHWQLMERLEYDTLAGDLVFVGLVQSRFCRLFGDKLKNWLSRIIANHERTFSAIGDYGNRRYKLI